MKPKLPLLILVIVVIVGSTALAIPHLSHLSLYRGSYQKVHPQSVSYPFMIFNRPISTNTDHDLDPAFYGSWAVDITSSLMSSSHQGVTEAEVALAPAADRESHAIPTIIVQERADGLLRVEYFPQNMPNTYGIILYNSTTPGWTVGRNVTLVFHMSGLPSQVDPPVPPRPNGFMDILMGDATVLSGYPIAWANLSELYLYGYPGSSFTGGSIQINLYQI